MASTDVAAIEATVRVLNRIAYAASMEERGGAPLGDDDAERWGLVDGLHEIGGGWFMEHWLPGQGLAADECGLAEIRGWEMEPMLPHGTVVMVDRSARGRRRTPMGIYMMETAGGDRLVRRLTQDPEGGWLMMGDHPRSTVVEIPRGARVVGRVTWSARNHPADAGDGLGIVFEVLGAIATLRSLVTAHAAKRRCRHDVLRAMEMDAFVELVGQLVVDELDNHDSADPILERATERAAA